MFKYNSLSSFLVVNAFFILCSCTVNAQDEKDERLKEDINTITEELVFMYEYDQRLREYLIFRSFDKSLTDSIENLSTQDRAAWIDNNSFQNEALSAQIMDEYIIPFDKKHTERLIEITEMYGFPGTDRIKRYYTKPLDSEFNPYIIFAHSQSKYWHQIDTLLKKELDEDRITNCLYGHFLWHINGRNDLNYMLNNGYQLIKDENGQSRLTSVDCE
ncbi:hypothetical protein E1176_16175 [Fulvivirga sp. RKSG066]|uniref:hypothetical protein n=1 Tax=Fulvivirga aurantia TaxID=2529383 RepID=UPI0012BCE43C|nr:hypothetical protein [Fulvivirga aurantia]MTI22570.1 hypothetical protein [Fulvivirga aurantia]